MKEILFAVDPRQMPGVPVPPIKAPSLQFWLLLGLFVLELPGAVVPFLAYMNGFSPLEAVVFEWHLGYVWLGLPFFVGLLVSAGLLRSLIPLRWTRFDLVVGYIGTIVGLGSTVVFVFLYITELCAPNTTNTRFLGFLFVANVLLFLIAAVTCISVNWRWQVPQSILVQMALRAAYIPNAVSCIWLFGFSNLLERDIGFWLSGYVTAVYVAVLGVFSVLLWKQTAVSRRC